jgi:coenzyme F420-reducing hydrogenase beta subunit
VKTIKIEDVTNFHISEGNIIVTVKNGNEYKANGDIARIENNLYCHYNFELWSNTGH